MGTNDSLPLVLNRANVDQFLDAHTDPDAERFRYFGKAMMDSVCSPEHPAPQTKTLQYLMDMYKPRTLDELRVCIDAATTLTP